MFKKIVIIAALTVSCFLMTGCYSVYMTAPPDSDVKLMSPAQSSAFVKKQKCWYALWGLVPIANAEEGVQNVIRDNGLKEVRVETKMTFTDFLISYFLSIVTIQTRTTIIEGNGN